MSYQRLSNNRTEVNSLSREVGSSEWWPSPEVCLYSYPWSVRRWQKRGLNNEKSHVRMELVGKRDGYKSKVILKTKGKTTQSNLQHGITYFERCMQDYSKRNSEPSNVILQQMNFLLGWTAWFVQYWKQFPRCRMTEIGFLAVDQV